MTALLIRYVAPSVIGIFCLVGLWYHGYRTGEDACKNEFATYKASLSFANSMAQKKISADFQALLTDRETNLQTIRTERDALLNSVRNRQPRPQSTPSTGGSTPEPATSASCSPKQLYREDAEAIAELASDAEAVRQELLSTREMYNNARDVMANGAVGTR